MFKKDAERLDHGSFRVSATPPQSPSPFNGLCANTLIQRLSPNLSSAPKRLDANRPQHIGEQLPEIYRLTADGFHGGHHRRAVRLHVDGDERIGAHLDELLPPLGHLVDGFHAGIVVSPDCEVQTSSAGRPHPSGDIQCAAFGGLAHAVSFHFNRRLEGEPRVVHTPWVLTAEGFIPSGSSVWSTIGG